MRKINGFKLDRKLIRICLRNNVEEVRRRKRRKSGERVDVAWEKSETRNE